MLQMNTDDLMKTSQNSSIGGGAERRKQENIFNVLKWRKALKRLRFSKQQNIHISTTYSLQKDSFLWKQWSHHHSAGWIMPRPTDWNRCENSEPYIRTFKNNPL